jgi:hypothetical protein
LVTLYPYISQDLEQVAALNDAGPDGIVAAQSAAGQLNAYTGLVQQAAIDARRSDTCS